MEANAGRVKETGQTLGRGSQVLVRQGGGHIMNCLLSLLLSSIVQQSSLFQKVNPGTEFGPQRVTRNKFVSFC